MVCLSTTSGSEDSAEVLALNAAIFLVVSSPSETLRVPTSVPPRQLYLHLVSHCKEFGTTTLDLKLHPAGSAAPDTAPEIGLLINVCKDSLGPTTSPQLSLLMQENKVSHSYSTIRIIAKFPSLPPFQASYSIRVVAIFTPLESSSDQVQYLQLVFYLLLVNKEDLFPCLTSPSPQHSASCHALPPTAPQREAEEEEESDLHLKVQEHRRKMGYGIRPSGSPASQLVLDKEKVEGQIHAVRTHLESVIQNALHHMKKDELWKRMLYGASHSSEGKTVCT